MGPRRPIVFAERGHLPWVSPSDRARTTAAAPEVTPSRLEHMVKRFLSHVGRLRCSRVSVQARDALVSVGWKRSIAAAAVVGR
jgi:hypothetical protein